jgi:malonyl-CoA decarboxylase
MERLNWMGDRSARGMRQSAGLMINYRYDLGRIDANHESYRSTGRRVVSPVIKGLLGD